jgi:hypothetical protein
VYSNQYGTYGRSENRDIGITPMEQRMQQGGMGGLPQVMRADHSFQSGGYGPTQYQSGQYGQQSGTQYGGYGGSQYGQPFGMQSGGYGGSQSGNIGTTPMEQRMQQGGMGGLSQVMRADHNFQSGGYGPTQYQTGTGQYGQQSGTQYGGYGGSQYGQPFGMQSGGYGGSQSGNIGTAPMEQRMQQGGMGGLSQVMRADHNFQSGGYGPTQYQSGQYGQQSGTQYGGYGGSQYGQPFGMQSGGYGGSQSGNIGTTPMEQRMQQGGMGGLSQVMRADHNFQSGSFGPTQYQTGTSQYSQSQSGYGMSSGQSGYSNPGDTNLERQAKQQMGVQGNFGSNNPF